VPGVGDEDLAAGRQGDAAARLGLLADREFTMSEQCPVPASVWMMPLVSTMRIIWLAWSAISRLPRASNSTATGRSSVAFEAGSPLPSKPRLPLPQVSVIAPVTRSTTFTRRG
jgi:hypothetical protein